VLFVRHFSPALLSSCLFFILMGACHVSSLRKTSHLFSALSKIVPEQTTPAPISYYALDLERRELERTLDRLAASPTGPEMQGKVDVRGLWGTFEGGLRFAAEGGLQGREAAVAVAAALRSRSLSSDGATTQPSSPSSSKQDSIETAPSTPDAATLEVPLHIVFLGFSLGNFPRGKDVEFLKALPLRAGKGDTLLIGLDHCTDSTRIVRAYNDRAGITRRFVLNGLKVAGRTLGDEYLFPPEKWEYVGRYNEKERESLLLKIVFFFPQMVADLVLRRLFRSA
jgi:L-histidine Nalpha-methyltransferase / hercynylcysteine S-oxide synthase